MTTSNSESHIQQSDPFASLYPHQFFLMTTFRKNGEAVPTTVWFAPDDAGHIYVTTQNSAGKMKRIRNNGDVRMTPSDARGTLVDGAQPISGYAREVESSEHAQAEAALIRKYGEEYIALRESRGPASQATRVFIEISPARPTL